METKDLQPNIEVGQPPDGTAEFIYGFFTATTIVGGSFVWPFSWIAYNISNESWTKIPMFVSLSALALSLHICIWVFTFNYHIKDKKK